MEVLETEVTVTVNVFVGVLPTRADGTVEKRIVVIDDYYYIIIISVIWSFVLKWVSGGTSNNEGKRGQTR